MPIFDYKCDSCDHIKECIVRNSEQEIFCEKCNDKMKRQLSTPAGFNFKGSGFSETDYKRKS